MNRVVTFSDESMSQAAQLCVESARQHNAEDVLAFTWESFKKSVTFANNREIFDQPKGLGFWAWKPWCIREAISCCTTGDVLIYVDAGVKVINNLNYVVDRMDQDIWLFGNEWEHYQWCKRDVIEAVWPNGPWKLLSPWQPQFFGKQAQASVIFFKVNDWTREFVKEWLNWCLVPHLIDDSPSVLPNHPDFREHRYDQAILTTMAYREGLKLHGWFVKYPTFEPERRGYPADVNIPTMFLHHRWRDHEWQEGALA